jgi:hypothetical protein
MSLEDPAGKAVQDLAEETNIAYHSDVPFIELGDLVVTQT